VYEHLEEHGRASARSQTSETHNDTLDYPKYSPSLVSDPILKEAMCNLHTPTHKDKESEGEYWACLTA
jgi:hypothetical protein